MDYLGNLNEKQREAALYTDGQLLILAGAGSGKTATMTHRIAYLVRDLAVNPRNILAVTFTNKAAGEMRERVENILGEETGMWILTFHQTCLRILRRHAKALGYISSFVIYDSQDQKSVVKKIMQELNVSDKLYTPQYLLTIISHCKENEIGPKDYLTENGEDFKSQQIASVYEAYNNALKANNAMDFDDLLVNAVTLLRNEPEILEYYQNRFKYVMVDEYQDTNRIQYKLVKLLSGGYGNLCVVGDDDQCIYQWRGADIRNILDFEKDFPNAKVIKLEQNYRSKGNILNASNSVIAKNSRRKSKRLWTAEDAGNKVVYFRTDRDKAEADFIADEIRKLHGSNAVSGNEYSDMAVLCRMNAQTRLFEEAFMTKGIPYKVLGGLKFYDRKEIKDITAYMRLVLNPYDNLAFERIINEPKRGIGPKTLDKIRDLSLESGISMLEVIADEDAMQVLPEKARESAGKTALYILEYSKETDNLRVSDIYDGILAHTGYLDALKAQNSQEADARIDNILEFKSVIADYEKTSSDPTLAEFLERVALVAEADNYNPQDDAVVIMTLHGAKGLEFPVVFIPGMEEGLFPGWRSKDSIAEQEEERRLCYVGMTRAKERLYMTGAEERMLFGSFKYTTESRFIKEIDTRYLDDRSFVASVPKKINSKRGNVGDSKGIGYNPYKAASEIKKKAVKYEISDGERVSHSKFGEGMVISQDDRVITVAFDSVGVKKLAKAVAPLEKI